MVILLLLVWIFEGPAEVLKEKEKTFNNKIMQTWICFWSNDVLIRNLLWLLKADFKSCIALEFDGIRLRKNANFSTNTWTYTKSHWILHCVLLEVIS